MCGRYTLHSLIEEIQAHYGLFGDISFAPSYNIAPSSRVPVVRQDEAAKELAYCRWGLVPGWMKTTPKTQAINARAETLAEKPFFRGAFKHRRCLIPANGFYEWRRSDAGKQPFFVGVANQPLFSFAGIWDRWNGPDGVVDTCAIITTGASRQIEHIHQRMPVILQSEDYACWLDDGSRDLLVPFAGELKFYPVSTRVNSPQNNSEELLRPVTGVEDNGAG